MIGDRSSGGRRPGDVGHTTLYKLMNSAGELIYIGVGSNPAKRFEQHKHQRPWWGEVASATFEHFPDRGSALRAETAAIKEYQPRYNVAALDWATLSTRDGAVSPLILRRFVARAGRTLRAARCSQGLSLVVAAGSLECSVYALRRIEAGEQILTKDQWAAACALYGLDDQKALDALNVSLDWLRDAKGTKSKRPSPQVAEDWADEMFNVESNESEYICHKSTQVR